MRTSIHGLQRKLEYAKSDLESEKVKSAAIILEITELENEQDELTEELEHHERSFKKFGEQIEQYREKVIC